MAESTKYTCEMCHNTYMSEGYSKEDKVDEFHTNFPTIQAKQLVIVCDDCYQILMSEYKKPKSN